MSKGHIYSDKNPSTVTITKNYFKYLRYFSKIPEIKITGLSDAFFGFKKNCPCKITQKYIVFQAHLYVYVKKGKVKATRRSGLVL